MSEQRRYIHELKEKLEYLKQVRDIGTWDDFAKVTGIDKSVLSLARARSQPGSGRLNSEDEGKVAERFKFSTDWPEWRDKTRLNPRSVGCKDTAEAFAKKFGDLPSARIDEQVKSYPGATQQSEIGNARIVAGEVVAGRRRPPSMPLGTMAQVLLDQGQPVGPGALQALVELSCHTTHIIGSNSRFSVRRALLAIDCKEARGRREAIAALTGGTVTLINPTNGERSTVTWCGSSQLLRWDVVAEGTTIGSVWFDAGIIEELAHGDVLRVSLSAWLKDIDASDSGDNAVFGIIDPHGQLAGEPADALTIEQQRIIQHLNKLKLPVDANGYAEIASHELEVVRKE